MKLALEFVAALGASLLLASAAQAQADLPAGNPDGAEPAVSAPPETPTPPPTPTPPDPSLPIQAAQPEITAQPLQNQPNYAAPEVSQPTGGVVTPYATTAPARAPMMYDQRTTVYSTAPATTAPMQPYSATTYSPAPMASAPIQTYPTTTYAPAPMATAPMQTYPTTIYAPSPTYGTTYVRGYSMAPQATVRRGPFRWLMRRGY